MNQIRKFSFLPLIGIILIVASFWFLTANKPEMTNIASTRIYEQRVNHSPDGIGKYYMGREIAKVMGHTGAGWLERPSRELEEQPSKIVGVLDLKPNDVVADIGAGTGYLSFLIAPLLPQGKVLAVDIQPEMLEIIQVSQQEKKITNVEPILATINNPNLPDASVDLALMVDAYHEFAYPYEVMQGLVKALKPGGRVVLVEYRGENPLIMIKRLHKMTQNQVRKEMQAVGLVWRETKNLLPQQHLMVFEKPVASTTR
ncbi:class I SAM-dependent methyltransferase [Nostoc sp. PCC 7107]|uniref:class I SAM-dependent methyltransferase n=1 Tax=Nostoc sp. PCC 7107 TaxID=317936 RepID=UPI00029EDCC9|nr:class I SAM-dependent methyltransferase [Nostoc sp. PCC 7107]AFY42214.1 Methyltransferase type 11 [Nostoc sp. PCC 7107]